MKKLLSRFNLLGAILLIIVPLAIALVVSVISSSINVNNVSKQAEELYFDNLYTINSQLLNNDRDLYQALTAAMQYYDLKNGYSDAPEEKIPELLESKMADFEENSKQAIDGVQKIQFLASNNESLYNETFLPNDTTPFSTYCDDFIEAYDNWIGMWDLEKNEGDWNSFLTYFRTDLRESISQMGDITELWAQNQKEIIQKETTRQNVFVVVVFLLISIAIIVFAVFVALTMVNGVKQVTGSIQILAGGNFNLPIDSSASVKEFNEIAAEADGMRLQIKDALTKVVESADSVEECADSTQEMISDSQKTSADINLAVGDLAHGATSMAEDVQTTAAITQEMGSAVEEVLASAEQNNEFSKQVYEESIAVKAKIEDLQVAGKNTRDKSEQVTNSVNKTSEVVQEISAAAESIIGIASQTNLLSLNASIEAARAGEAGRGFSVVAGEIAKLANQADETAKNITAMLKQIVALSGANMTLTQDIKTAIEEEGVVLSGMIDSFVGMQEKLKETEEGNNHISELVNNLNHSKDSIMEAVESLSSISEENAASTQETSASLTQLENNMENVVEQANELKGISDQLKNNLSVFKIS